ncbi:MAG: penicillin-binding transpeptidase domain-containing protein [Thermodesulfobacteriota bacterium]
MNGHPNRSQSWREFQKASRRGMRKRRILSRLPWVGFWLVAFSLMLGILFYSGTWLSAHLSQTDCESEAKPRDEAREPQRLTRQDAQELLRETDLSTPPFHEKYALVRNGERLLVETSLDPALQTFVHDLLSRSLTIRASMAVLNPATGQVLAMADYENGNRRGNGSSCLRADYPAASLFKIVTAAAAIQGRGLSPESTMTLRGRKYTLYRSQLSDVEGRSDTRMTLKEAFSESINPIFGKIGIHELGKDLTGEYAERFLFNRPIPFDLPLAVSPIHIPEDDFGLAEIASGFNKTTMISPLHAALLSAAVANRGAIMEPWLIKQITDEKNAILYSRNPATLANPMSAKTAGMMRELMYETVVKGTARKAFRLMQKKKSLHAIELGAKTGTINDPVDQNRVDWITAYAIPEGEEGGICLAGLAIHGEKSGHRAKDMVRAVIEHYFSP